MVERVSFRLLEGVRTEGQRPTVERLPYRDFVMRYLPHYFSRAWSRMHTEFAEEFTDYHLRRGRREGIVAPRGGAKTTHWSKAYPLYCICYELEHYILLLASTVGQSERNLAAIKNELEGNLLLHRDFPDVAGAGPVWNVKQILTRNGVAVEALGRGNKVRGATHGHYRPGLIIGDDVDDDDSVETEKAQAKAWNWLTKTIIPLGIENQVNVAIAGTVQNPNDITQKIKRTPGWRARHYRALMRWPERMELWDEWAALYRQQTIDKNEGRLDDAEDPAREFYLRNKKEMDRGAVVQWEAQESLYDLMVYIQRNGKASFESEKQGNAPVSDRAEWAPALFPDSIYFTKFPGLRRRVMVCDPSKGKSEKSDYSAWVWGGLGYDGLIYVDADIRRRDSARICRDGAKLAAAFQPNAIGIEEDAYGAIGELWNMICREEGILVQDVRLFRNKNAKLVRIRRLTEPLQAFRFKFRENSPGVKLLISQLQNFPLDSHDDGPDALEMMHRMLMALTAEERAIESTIGDQDSYSVDVVET